MKVMLDNTVQSSNCLDNCRPQRMSNPETGKALELDRLYFPNAAFELQGRQHHQLTSMRRDEQHFEQAKLLDCWTSPRSGLPRNLASRSLR